MSEVDRILDLLTDAVTPLVEQIEQSTPTTRGHYADYMSAIDRVAQMFRKGADKKVYLGVAIAMKRAGANAEGVHDALKLLGKI